MFLLSVSTLRSNTFLAKYPSQHKGWTMSQRHRYLSKDNDIHRFFKKLFFIAMLGLLIFNEMVCHYRKILKFCCHEKKRQDIM